MTEPLRGVVPGPDGGVTVNLSNRERDLLRSLPSQLQPLLTGDDAAPNVASTLYSRGYEDDELESEYRSLAGDDIVAQRVSAMETFAETLDAGSTTGGRWRADLDAQEAAAWLSAVNDGRLVLGALLGITDEAEWERGPSDDEPASVVLYYLGWLQEELVEALMGQLRQD